MEVALAEVWAPASEQDLVNWRGDPGEGGDGQEAGDCQEAGYGQEEGEEEGDQLVFLPLPR